MRHYLKLATLVNINLTELPLESQGTDTADIIDEVKTAAVVLTRGLPIRTM